MTGTRRYLLHPRGAFHFGERGIGVEETAELLHSDTLFSAIVSAWRMLDESQLDKRLQPFVEGRPPFRISSALPFAGPITLFPRPVLPLGVEKALKKVSYVSPAALALICQNRLPSSERVERELIQGGDVWVLPEERAQIAALLLEGEPDEQRRAALQASWEREPTRMRLWWAGDLTPRVSVDRRSSAANLFHVGRLRFAHGCGLAFWASFADDAYVTHLEDALTFLQDEGLGGKRSVGYGQFDWDGEDVDLPADDEPTHHMALSLYAPRPEERGLLGAAWYKRILRQGWIFSPEGRNLRRRGIWMLREGALLAEQPLGDMADVRPEIGFDHSVWRYGYALTMPLRIEYPIADSR